jgi:hypothetical protein
MERVMVEIPEGKRLLGRSRSRWHVLVGDKYGECYGGDT